MSTILHINSSIRSPEESVTRALSRTLVESLNADGNATVISRDLADNDIPFVDADRFAANLTPFADRTDAQKDLTAIADTLIKELQDADTIVFGVPIYNFGPPAVVKAWADMVARAGTTFEYTENGPKGKLAGKKAYLAIASGGTAVGGEMDFMSSWLKFFLGFLGISDVEMVYADGIMGEGGEEKIAAAKDKAATMAG